MGEQTIQRFCPQCQRNVAAARPGVNHVLHAIITIFSCGAWGIVWLCLIVFGGGTYKCSFCANAALLPAQPLPPPQMHGGYGPPPGYGPPGGYGPPPGSGYGPPR